MEEHTSELLIFKHLEDLEYFSLQLDSLKDAFDLVSLGFQQQQMGPEIISCLEILKHSVNDIQNEMKDKMQALLSK